MNSLVRHARSWLFVPAMRPERLAKALATRADVVILDLEDAVAAPEKDEARRRLAQALQFLQPAERARCIVRINGFGTRWHAADVEALAAWTRAGLAGVMLPKAEGVEPLSVLVRELAATACVVPLIESLRGLDAVDLVARAPSVERLAFGHLDFQLDVGMQGAADQAPLQPVRTALVLASRRAGLPAPIDGVTVDKDATQACQSDARRARQGGFGGKLCIHPAQVDLVNEAFSSSEEEMAWARRVLDAAGSQEGGVFSLDGRMVDAPVVAAARVVLDRAPA